MFYEWKCTRVVCFLLLPRYFRFHYWITYLQLKRINNCKYSNCKHFVAHGYHLGERIAEWRTGNGWRSLLYKYLNSRIFIVKCAVPTWDHCKHIFSIKRWFPCVALLLTYAADVAQRKWYVCIADFHLKYSRQLEISVQKITLNKVVTYTQNH